MLARVACIAWSVVDVWRLRGVMQPPFTGDEGRRAIVVVGSKSRSEVGDAGWSVAEGCGWGVVGRNMGVATAGVMTSYSSSTSRLPISNRMTVKVFEAYLTVCYHRWRTKDPYPYLRPCRRRHHRRPGPYASQ